MRCWRCRSGYLAVRWRRLYQPIINVGGVVYSIPSLALFAVIPAILATGILSPVNVVVGLTLYTLALLTRTVADGLISVQGQTTMAAQAMGYRPLRQLLGVELPMAVPVLFAGLRVATVANISLVSVGALVGAGGLGNLFTGGFQLGFTEPIIIGIVLSMLLAGLARHRPGRAAAGADAVGPGGWSGMNLVAPAPLVNYFSYLLNGANWHLTGDSSIPERIGQHVAYVVVTLVIGAAIALPVGLFIGHTNRGAFFAIALGNLGRSLPTFGLVLLLVVTFGVYQWPVVLGLVVLAIPPILAQTYAGIRSVDRSAVDAAVGMGMRPRQVLFSAELPMALPLIIGGLRSAVLQVTATATIAAYASFGGLGRLLIDGLNRNDYPQIMAGALLVAALAVALDYLSAAVERAVVSPGVRERPDRRTRRSRTSSSNETAASTS